MTTAIAYTVRTARKDYPCARQAYYDRLSPESREWQRAVECPYGGRVLKGDSYAETEGVDVFHPDRQHVTCLEWTVPA